MQGKRNVTGCTFKFVKIFKKKVESVFIQDISYYFLKKKYFFSKL